MRQTPGRSTVLECAMVTVQLAASSSCAIGLPTSNERPTTTACLPVRSPRVAFSSSRQPVGVQATRAGSPATSRPALTTCRPSTSLSGPISSITGFSSRGFGSGSCTRMPWILGSAASSATSASSVACGVSVGSRWVTECMPAAFDRSPFDFT